MDSNNWRVKRDPVDSPLGGASRGSPLSQRRQDGGAGRGGFEQRGSPAIGRLDQRGSREGFKGDAGGFRKPVNDAKADQAIEEGRRLYVGNLPYEATVKDVEGLFNDLAAKIEAINMAVDPMTGRNPSYCFVDFNTKELADRVMSEYDGQEFMRRNLKVKHGVKSSKGNVGFDARSAPKSEDNRYAGDRWRRNDKPEEAAKANEEGRRVYVGGLPRFENQRETHEKIRELFAGFNVEVISKLVSPYEGNPDTSHFCFVDLASRPEAEEAIKALNGRQIWNELLRVNHAKGTPKKLNERRRLFVGGLPEFPDQESTEAGIKELFAGYEVTTISKLFPPKEIAEDREGNHCFCFVELEDQDQTDKAIVELDWKEAFDGKVRVKPSISAPRTGANDVRTSRGWGSK